MNKKRKIKIVYKTRKVSDKEVKETRKILGGLNK